MSKSSIVDTDEEGLLRVKVMEGRNLEPMDRSGLSDPFVVVVFGNNKMKTKHIKQTLDPIWTAEDRGQFEFKVNHTMPGILQFEMFDWNRVSASKRMGFVEISGLGAKLDAGKNSISDWFPLQAKKAGDKVRGDLKIVVELEITSAPKRRTQLTMDGLSTADGQLEEAVQALDLVRVEQLVKSLGADEINKQDRHGYTPLHAAAVLFGENDSAILCAILKHKGIDVNLVNIDQNTPLHFFCKKYRSPDCADAFKLFMEKGADVDAVNKFGETPVHHAMHNDSVRVILLNLLIEANANVDKTTKEFGETALHYAVRYGRDDLVSILVEAGADLTIKEKKNKQTPIDVAKAMEQEKVVDMLERAQAVYEWLEPMGLKEYGKLFFKEELYMDVMGDLSEQLLTSMGVKKSGHRVKLLQASKKLGGEGKAEAEDAKGAGKKDDVVEADLGPVDEAKRNENLQAELQAMKYLKKTDWVLRHNELEFFAQLGTGAAGIVYRGKYQDREVAIKVLKSNQSDKEEDEFRKEFQIMAAIEHPNLVFFFGAVLEPRLCMVLELCTQGALFDVLNSAKVHMTWDKLFSYAKDFTRGLMALHQWEPQIVHRDFKSLNVLVNKEDTCKVADFGLSRFNTETQKETLAKMRGTFAYVSPEVYFGEAFSTKSDVFSVSLVLWELVMRLCMGEYQRPYAEFKNLQFDFQIIIQTAKKDLRPTIDEKVPEQFADLIRRTWSKESDERPECEELLEILDKMYDDYKANPQPWLDALKKEE